MRYRQATLFAALAALVTLGACRHGDPATPDAHRFDRVALPEVPPGEAVCADAGGGEQPCLSEAQGDRLFNDVVDALCEANDRLAWLSDYYLGTALGPSCAPGTGAP